MKEGTQEHEPLPPEPQSHDPVPWRQEASMLLADILADRQGAHGAGGEVSQEHILDGAIEGSGGAVLENLRLLRCMNGHRGSMLRKIVVSGTASGSAYLHGLFNWSVATARGETDHVILLSTPPEALLECTTPEQLYERLIAFTRHPEVTPETIEAVTMGDVRAVLGLPDSKSKWIDLIPAVFNAKNHKEVLAQILDKVGYIPEDLTNRKAFEKVPAPALIKTIDALRELEQGPHGEHARYERSRLLNAIVAGGNLRELKEKGGTITLDTNGIFINAGALHAHLPFGLLTEDAVAALADDGWMTEEALAEARLRAVVENNISSGLEEGRKKQLELFLEAIGSAGKSVDQVADELVRNPQYVAAQMVKGDHIIPDLLLDALHSRGVDGISAIAEFGEAISEELVKAHAPHRNEDGGVHDFTSHRLLSAPEREYERRSAVVNNPKYYNAHKMLRGVLEANVVTSTDDEFIVLRGDYRRVRNGDKHSFVEVLNKGKIARVLVNEEKQLSAPLRKAFERLPHYEREQYEDLERAVTAYKHFAQDLARLRQTKDLSITAYQDYEFWRAAKDALGFLSGHASPEHFRFASELFDKVEAAVHEESYKSMHEYAEKFLALVEECDRAYRAFLYASIGKPVNFTEAFMPEITKTDVSFGARFVQEARDKCVAGGYDEKLSARETDVRVVSLDYKESDPTATIPFHVEADALNALRLSPRKFLNVAGGARLMEARDQEAMEVMISELIGVAHEHQLNVAVPGTQVGIGRLFGAANMEYRSQFAHLPLAKQARLFAISPGGNTYYPGNPYLTKELASQTYAMSPVDTIVTPFGVDWDAKGLAKRYSLYLNHVAYMEALYDRASNKDQRAMLLLNGGLYTLIEATEAYRRGFPLILAEDSGRLAQVLAEYVHTQQGGGPTSENSEEEMYHMVMSAVEKLPANIAQEFTEKDFGRAAKAENDDYLVYREYLYRMLRVIEYSRWEESKSGVSQIITMKRDAIPAYLRNFYAQEFKGNKRGPSPIPSIKKWESPYFTTKKTPS